MDYLWVALGSALGGMARYWCSGVAARLIGATSISHKKPNSRSQTMEAAEKIAVNSTDMASTPG